jgi:hypothetical protein
MTGPRSAGAGCVLAHRLDAAAFAAGGKACNPRILGMGADSGHHEQRSPSMQIPAHRGQSFRRIADSVPVIADSF